jgi:large subunit ribosomal protein L6
MSRIGVTPIPIPEGVEVDIKQNEVVVKGPKGEEKSPLYTGIHAKLEDGQLVFTLDDAYISGQNMKEQRKFRSLYGLVRALANNSVQGVTTGFTKVLEIRGVGYRVQEKGRDLQFQLGFSHDVVYNVPEGVSINVKSQTELEVTGTSKEKVGQVAAEIRSLKRPEPYKGKGIRYKDERVIMKAGKVGKK